LKHIKGMPCPPLPSASLGLEQWLYALLEYDGPEDEALRSCLLTLQEWNCDTVAEVYSIAEEQLKAMPLLEGHQLALQMAREKGKQREDAP
jgi:hypothetical protein